MNANEMLSNYMDDNDNLKQSIINKMSAKELLAAYESKTKNNAFKINNPQDAYFALKKYRYNRQESFWVLILDGAHNIVRKIEITRGTVNRTLVHPREVFRPAILSNAQAIVAVHNHPSGALEPSKEDIELTERIKKAGDIIGIEVLDHVIISKFGYYSFLEKGCMP